MPPRFRRYALVLILVLAAEAASLVVRAPAQPQPGLPAVEVLTAGTRWTVDKTYDPGGQGMVFGQWLLGQPAGSQAELFVGATNRVQTVLAWSGELGYLGDGYVVAARAQRSLSLSGGGRAAVSAVTINHLADRLIVEYAVVRPDGVVPAGTAMPGTLALNILTGRRGPYYLMRATAPITASDREAEGTASQLLADLLPPMLALARRQLAAQGA